MGLEVALHIDELVAANPVGATDALSTADDHLRLIKDVLKRDFPDVDQATSSIISSTIAPPLARKATIWFDETTNLLKIRDEADTAWITLPISITTDNTVDIDGGTIDGATLTANTITTGTINDTPIGGTTPNAIAGTTLSLTGAFTTTSTIDGRDVAADGTKLDGIDAGANVVPTGVMSPYVGTTAPTDWILADGGTIGNGSSGGTTRANADTEDLFTLFYDSMTDTEAPVSGGRGASAAIDFAANKTITISDLRGAAVFGTGGTKMATHGDTGGVEEHTLAESEMPAHTHTQNANAAGGSAGPVLTGDTANTDAGETDSTGGDGAHENMPPWVALSYIIKL